MVCLLVACIWIYLPAFALAQTCWRYSADPGTGSATISLDSWTPSNRVIGPWISIRQVTMCSHTIIANSFAWYINGRLHAKPPSGTTLGGTITVDGINYQIFIPQNTNIGYIVRMRIGTSNAVNGNHDVGLTWSHWGKQSSLNRTYADQNINSPVSAVSNQAVYKFQVQTQIRLVKINASYPANSSTVNFAALQSDIDVVWSRRLTTKTPTYTARANVTFNVTTPSCTTPSLAHV